jgi:hypothetical protein
VSDETKELAHELYREISKLYLILEQCRQLYSNAETVSVLNKTASLFFRVVQSQFFDALILGICRLTDKEKIGTRKNLSINAIHSLIEDSQLKSEVIALCDQAVSVSNFAREHRNKRISHLDLEHYKSRGSSPLDTATFAKIENSLKAIEAVIDLVFSRVFKTANQYKFINLQGSADMLVGKLKQLHTQSLSR